MAILFFILTQDEDLVFLFLVLVKMDLGARVLLGS